MNLTAPQTHRREKPRTSARLPRSLAAKLGIARRRVALMSGMGERYDVAKAAMRRVLAEVAKFRELTEAERFYLAEVKGGDSDE